jgi:choline dehydrogenase-like flavoprotein
MMLSPTFRCVFSRHCWQDSLKGRRIGQTQGRVLGGSSAINLQALIAPSKSDIDNWEKLGNSGWNWGILAPYYKKFYTLTAPSIEACDHLGIDWIGKDIQGLSGPVQASFTGVVEDPLSKAWIDTFRHLGYPLTGDPFSGKFTGAYSSPSTVNGTTKERSYAATAYYVPASGRPNLHLLNGSLVERIALEDVDNITIASGVQFIHKGERRIVKASKEVILAAGVFQSPKLLELSGIGATSVLQLCNITVRISNPFVGENLQDHVLTGVSFELKEGVHTADDLLRQNPDAIQAAMTAYQTSKTGPLCSGGVNSFAFMPVVEFLEGDGKANLQELLGTHVQAITTSEHPAQELRNQLMQSLLEDPDEGSAAFFTFTAQTNLGNSLELKPLTTDLQPGNYLTLAVALLHPFSTGNVHIMSKDPTHPPTIDPKYLSHPLDLEIFARHVRYLETIAETKPLASFLKPNGRRNAPGAYVKDLDSAKEYARLASVTNYHCVGTCSMLPPDKGGVVSERLVVYGTKNLRVVDASIMPIIPQANTQSTVYAVAERAADLIKMDHALKAAL